MATKIKTLKNRRGDKIIPRTLTQAILCMDGRTFQQMLDDGDLNGQPGPTGGKGEKGDAGATGATGATGPQGAIGLTGEQGPSGAEGPKGEPGTPGPKGDIGPVGEKGADGIQGPKGDNGEPFSIAKTYDTVAAMNADFDNPVVTVGQFVLIDTGNIEDADNAKLYVKGTSAFTFVTDLSGATGMTGPQGTQGPQGVVGPIGPAGSDGPQGPIGLTGPSGATGPAGAKGEPGAVGPKGDAGATGATGATGPQGPQGVVGPIGPVGSVGPKGDDAYVLKFTNVGVAVATWVANSTYSSQGGYNFRAAVPCAGATANLFPTVALNCADAISGNFAPIIESYAGGVYIYCKTKPTAVITIPSIILA